jgi:hypothetical protein
MGVEMGRFTYGEWNAKGRQVKKGQRRGSDGKFGYEQTKAAGGPRICRTCGCRINYGVYCGKCEYSR